MGQFVVAPVSVAIMNSYGIMWAFVFLGCLCLVGIGCSLVLGVPNNRIEEKEIKQVQIR